MEAILLAGGKAERLGDAAGGRPKALVDVAGKPLAAYQVGRLARTGVTRVIISCAAGQGDVIEGFSEGGRIPYWVNCGIYVLSAEAIERLPEVGDHETTTFQELVRERRLHAYRHEGLWLTVNTPKELRVAADHVASHPEW